MTGEKNLFTSIEYDNIPKETIVFGDNSKDEVIGLGKIALAHDNSITNVYLVETLGYNLLSVSQLCGMGYNCLFTNEGVTVFRRDNSSIAFTGQLRGKVYIVDFSMEKVEPKTCTVVKSDMGWVWHRRLAHVGMRNLAKLQKEGHILRLTNIIFEKDRLCSACQAGKQIGAPHPAKNILTSTRPLKLLHMDFFGPITYISIGGNKYGLVIVDDFSRFTWCNSPKIYQSKSRAKNNFQNLFCIVELKSFLNS